MHFAKSLKNAFLSIPAVFRARFARSLAHRCVTTSSIVPPLEESVRRCFAAVEAKVATTSVLVVQQSRISTVITGIAGSRSTEVRPHSPSSLFETIA